MAKVLVIDDDRAFAEGLTETLKDLGHEVLTSFSAEEGFRQLENEPVDVIFVDYRMPKTDGLEATKLIQEKFRARPIPVIMITAFVSSENTIAAMKLGAFDHLTKPVNRKDIERVLQSALKSTASSSNQISAQDASARKRSAPLSADTLIGDSEPMREIQKMIGRLTTNQSSVLITGETGTGKELVARALHMNSHRAARTLVAINCAAIPENLLESELFGHVKGAFTGASNDRVGSFKQADGGTLFLDEIGDMSLPLQAKILRAIQEKEITPVGASRPIKIDARIVAATHQNLSAMVQEKQFREDLYYRLNVVEIHLPPLRDRKADIPSLTDHFLNLLVSSQPESAKDFTTAARNKLLEHAWPGNVRELKNVVERAFVIARGNWIEADDIRFLDSSSTKVLSEANGDINDLDLPSSIAKLERKLITEALRQTKGNRTEAARLLGIQRQLLYTKLKEHRIEGSP